MQQILLFPEAVHEVHIHAWQDHSDPWYVREEATIAEIPYCVIQRHTVLAFDNDPQVPVQLQEAVHFHKCVFGENVFACMLTLTNKHSHRFWLLVVGMCNS